VIKRGDRVLVTRESLEAVMHTAWALGISEAEALERVVWVRGRVVDDDGWGCDVKLATGRVVYRAPRAVKLYSAVDALADLHRCEGCMDHGPDRCQRHHTNCPDGLITWTMVESASTASTVVLDLEVEGSGGDALHRKPRGDAEWRDYLPRGRGSRVDRRQRYDPHKQHKQRKQRKHVHRARRSRAGRRGHKAR